MAQSEVSTLDLDSDVKMKTKDGNEFKYKGITAAQVVARAKSALIRFGILYMPEVDRGSAQINGNKTTIWVSGIFENVDDPTDSIQRGAFGSGTDNADNGYAKAFTNANKQILTKTLNMTTVEDDSTQEIEHKPEGNAKGQADAEALSEAAIRTWGDAYRDALRGCKSKKDLKRIRAENAPMMKRVPAITAEYFSDMIAELEGTLE
jgi:hypothetical protein